MMDVILLFSLIILPYPFGLSSSTVPTTASFLLSLLTIFFIEALLINGISPHNINSLLLDTVFFFSAAFTAPAVPLRTFWYT